MLEEGKNSRSVLSAGGSAAGFAPGKAAYPDIEVSWHFSADESPSTRYIWNGHNYEEQAAKPVKKRAKKALELYKSGKVEEAIKIWEEAYQQSAASLSAEDYNNLGFAYYTVAKRQNSAENYVKAHTYLDIALQAQPKRWTAHLNLADLYAEEKMFTAAIEEYQKVLELKPDYKHAAALRDKISQLKLEPREVGVEVVALRHESGGKNITFTRLDEHKVMNRGYFENGKTRFEVVLLDGAEDGPYRSWFENGQLSVRGTQRMGKAIGTWEYFDTAGEVSQVLVHYPDGSLKDVTPKR
nr:tetratricopeptide repeat protein [Geomonas sp. Red32]